MVEARGVARLLREARAAGKQLAIVATTAAANVTPLIANALGQDAYYWFKAIVSAEHVAHKKPAPDLYQLVLSELALPASECVAFEDSANGVRAAQAATHRHEFGEGLLFAVGHGRAG